MWWINYVKKFDTLLVKFKSVQPNKIIEIEDAMLFFVNDDLVGANLFNISSQILFTKNWLNENEQAIKFIENKFSKYNIKHNKFGQFQIGKVLTCEEMKGTHLKRTTVDFGDSVEQIVCGASNVKEGKLVVGARCGAFMIDGTPIVKSKLKDVDSNGMLTSVRELNMQTNAFNNDGIILLNENEFNESVGMSFWHIIEQYGHQI